MFLTCLTAFLSGLIFESGCVWWVHFSERGKAVQAALISMLCALTQVVGIGEAIHDWRVASLFILGYGVGTYLMIKMKKHGPR